MSQKSNVADLPNRDPEPRSVRLNKNHRADIVAAVMKNWDKNNPAPGETPIVTLLRALLTRSNRGKGKIQHPGMAKLVDTQIAANKLSAVLSPNDKKLVTFTSETSLQLNVYNAEGDFHTAITVEMPVKLANELELPYFSMVEKRTFLCGVYWPTEPNNYGISSQDRDSYGYGEWVKFAVEQGKATNHISVDMDSKPYRSYLKTQREIRLHEKARRQMQEEVADYLDQFNTTKQIRDGWPELVDFLPAHIADPARVIQLPAVTTSRLNERLGL